MVEGDADALPAVHEVHPYGGPGGIGIAGRDGAQHLLVLLVDAPQVLPAAGGVVLERVDPGARDQQGAELAEQLDEVAVAGGLGDQPVEALVTSCSVMTSASVRRNAARAPSRDTNAPLP